MPGALDDDDRLEEAEEILSYLEMQAVEFLVAPVAAEIAAAVAAKEKEIMSNNVVPLHLPPVPGPSNHTSLIGGARPEPAPPEYGETSITDRFVAAFGRQLSYIKSRKQWLHWEGKRWLLDNKGFVQDLVVKHCKAESALCASTPGYTAANARTVCSKRMVDAVLSLASSDQGIATEQGEWDQDPWLLGTPDGIVDLRTSTLRAARPEDRVTKSTAVSPSGDACPLWLSFLHRATGGNVELQNYLQRMCGYFLTGSVREESLHFNYGEGGGGKGTFTRAVSRILGDYHVATAISTFTETKQDRHLAEIAVMQGARLVTCSETERGRRWAESRIKEMTGDDVITARFMNGNPFNFFPTHKIMVSGNYKPRLRPDKAMQRRFLLNPFDHKIPPHEVDKNLKTKLEQEWGAILGWMIEGCRLWQKHGLQPPAAVVDATDEYMLEEAEDCFAMWLADCCEAHADAETLHGFLYSSYESYAKRSGEKQPLTSVQLAKDLKNLGYGKKRTKLGRFVVGLRLQLPVPPPMPEL
jgi:putative DNA primase/helicase